MGPNKQARTQQSKASGAVYLLIYCRFCGPWGSLGVLGASLGVPGCPRGVPVGSQERPLGVPGECPEVPGALGSQKRAQRIPWIPCGLRGRPGHPRDRFHKDDSGRNMIP